MHRVMATALIAVGIQLSACAQESPTSEAGANVMPVTTGRWQCPGINNCSGTPDYVAFVANTPQLETFITFRGDLKSPFTLAQLQEKFMSIDLYIAQSTPNAWTSVNVLATQDNSGSVRFTAIDGDVVRMVVQSPRHTLRTERHDAACRADDVKGRCIEERRIDTPIELSLDIALPPLMPSR